MIPFVIKGVDAVDEGAHGSTIGFRVIIIPGTIVFWPVLLKMFTAYLPSSILDNWSEIAFPFTGLGYTVKPLFPLLILTLTTALYLRSPVVSIILIR